VGARETVRTERAATGGAVARSASGQVIFVRHALPNETVEVEITELASRFARADAVGVLEPSAQRVAAPCRYAATHECGGCDLQHATTAAQLAWKSDIISEHLARIAGDTRRVTVASLGAEQGSRTRLRCAVDADGHLGLRRARRHDIVALEACWLAHDSLLSAFSTDWSGFDEVELRAIGDEPLAVARREEGDDTIYELFTLNRTSLPASTVSRVVVNGQGFQVGPLSFWQSHRSAPELLSQQVLDLLGASEGDQVTDLFSGVGLFALSVASVVGPSGRVIAVESSRDAVNDAEANARSQRHVVLRNWAVTPRAINDSVSPGQLVVLDPPRSGAGKAVMSALVRRRPRRMVYVSCDAATFARDVKVATDAGYVLGEVRGFDLFPMTEHVELVGVLDDGS
jgi:tRNA/tmRNA/rRNA uracil-C5-methylase (TrmA/RlmC/RlmD family)